MYCPNCGKERMGPGKKCEHCGYVFDKKPLSRRWWFWVIFAFLCLPWAFILMLLPFMQMTSPGETPQAVSATKPQSATAPASVEESVANDIILPVEETTPEDFYFDPDDYEDVETESEYKMSCQSVAYKDLARNPNNYNGERLVFTCEVTQVMENTFSTDGLRLLVLEGSETEYDFEKYDRVILGTLDLPENGPRILEDDVIIIYGEGRGLRSVTTILGQDLKIPEIEVEYYEFVN